MISFFDGHCDTIMEIKNKGQRLFDNDRAISIKKLQKFNAPSQIFAIFLKDDCAGNYFNKTVEAIYFFNNELAVNKQYINLAINSEDIKENKRKNLISAFLAIEGGEALEGKIDNVEYFYKLGVRLITLTWNRINELGSGVRDENNGGLTRFGKEVVVEMNRLGMIVDVSHLTERGFWDVFEITKKPFIASHSNCYSLRDVKRNLTDDQMKALASRNGVMGLNVYPHFLTANEIAYDTDIYMHIDYMMRIVGENHISLGCDYDGISDTPEGFSDVTSLYKIHDYIVKKYGSSVAEKIMEKNLQRVVCEICG